MRIDAALGPAEIERLAPAALEGRGCVVFDVLRATSTIVTALAAGASAVLPVATIGEAEALKKERPGRLLGGERHGLPPEGFDCGNSPLEYLAAAAGREVILTTTNGTWAVGKCAGARAVWIGALLNLDATARALARSGFEDVLLVCAGTFETVALEDVFAAGALITALRTERLAGKEIELTDAARIAEAVFALYDRTGAKDCLARARNGRALLGRGWADQVEWCARCAVFDLAVEYRDGRCVAAAQSAGSGSMLTPG